MNNNSFTNLIWRGLLDTWGVVLTLFGTVSTIIGYFLIPETDTIALRWFITLVLVILLLMLIAFRTAWLAFNDTKKAPPKVLFVRQPPAAYGDGLALFLIEPTPLFSYDNTLALYYKDNGIEKLLGIGRVINVQEDGKLQVLVLTHWDESVPLNPDQLNTIDEKAKLLVKAGIPALLLEKLSHGK